MTSQEAGILALKAAEAGKTNAIACFTNDMGDNEVCRILNSGGYNLMHFACGNGHLATTQWLARRFRILMEQQANCGRTPLEWATHKGKDDIAAWLGTYMAADREPTARKAIIVLGGPLRPGDDRCSPPLNAATHDTQPSSFALMEKGLRVAALAEMCAYVRNRAFGELPGLWLKFRLEEALRLQDLHGGKSLLVFTGGDCGSCSPVVEADAMLAWAMNRGIPRNSIALDRCACNTVDNAWYVSRILMTHQIDDVLIVTSSFHIERTRACFDPILTAFGGVSAQYVGALDGYDGRVLEQRLKMEREYVQRFRPAVQEAVKLIMAAQGDVTRLRAHLYDR